MQQYRISFTEAQAIIEALIKLSGHDRKPQPFPIDFALRCLKARFADNKVNPLDPKTIRDTRPTLAHHLIQVEIDLCKKTLDTTDPLIGSHESIKEKLATLVSYQNFVSQAYADRSLRIEGEEFVSGGYNLQDFVKLYDAGHFNLNSLDDMIDAGWYDWFCKDSSLGNRLKKMMSMVKAANDCPAIDSNKVYVFFKNNCPCSGGTYDSFSICDMKTQDVYIWVTAKTGHKEQCAQVVIAPHWGINVLIAAEHGNGASGVKNFFKKLTPELYEAYKLKKTA